MDEGRRLNCNARDNMFVLQDSQISGGRPGRPPVA